MKKLHPVEKEGFTNRGLIFINGFLDVCSKITNILCKIMCNQYPTSYYWETDARTEGRMHGQTQIFEVFVTYTNHVYVRKCF